MLENIKRITSANYLENNGGKSWPHQSFFPLYPEKIWDARSNKVYFTKQHAFGFC